MKNGRSILDSLVEKPQFHSLGQHRCYRYFIALLPPRFQTAIAFVYIKNETLFVALRHPGYKMELNYNQDLLKSVLTLMRTNKPECAEYAADNVVIFASKYHTPAESSQETEETVPHYHEQALGQFDAQNIDPILQEKFDRTRQLIAYNRESEYGE